MKEGIKLDILLSKGINSLYNQNEYMKDFNGYIFIRKGIDILFEQSFGMADYSKMKKHDINTAFCLGSITKQFTAMCVLMLDQWRLLSIDDSIGEYLSDFDRGSFIKIRDILNMVSGMPEYWCQPGWKEVDGITQDHVYNFIRTLKDYKPAGEHFQYCNSNYIVLGVLIEKVSGMKYADFIQKYIFGPLGMNRSGWLPFSYDIDNAAVGYQSPRIGPPVERKPIFSTFGAGNIYSTSADLCKWDEALYTEKLINSNRLNQMFTPVLGDYGMGWFIKKNKIFHGGDMPGFSTRITRYPKGSLLILLLCNTDGCKESNMGHYADLVEKYVESLLA